MFKFYQYYHLKNLYYFANKINTKDLENIKKKNNLHIVYQLDNYNIKELEKLKNFCKKKFIKLLIIDNHIIAKKLKLDGFVISHNNKNNYKNIVQCWYKNFIIIGKVHNQRDYFWKLKQRCKNIMLSPIFYTKKYSFNKILGITKFKLISLNWEGKIYALGGINENTKQKLKLTKVNGFGFSSLENLSLK
jgi:thiamine-phosphate pyrophosphorylase